LFIRGGQIISKDNLAGEEKRRVRKEKNADLKRQSDHGNRLQTWEYSPNSTEHEETMLWTTALYA